MGVLDALTVGRHDRLIAALHVPLAALGVGVVLHGEGAHLGDGLARLPGLHVSLLADEVGVLDLGSGQTGFERVVLRLEFGPHQAITLLHPARGAVHSTAGGPDAVALAGLEQGIPQGGAVVPGGVDLPAGVADVGDAEQTTGNTGDLDLTDRTVGRALLAEVVSRQLAEHGGGVGAPQTEGGDVHGRVVEPDRSVGRHVLADPELVPTTVEHAGHDPDMVVTETHHGQVGVEATVGGEPRGVDAAAHRLVHLVHGQVVGELNRTGTGQVVDLEGRQVDHTAVLPQIEVLGVGDGAPPTVVPLGVPLAQPVALDQVGVGVVPLGPLPHPGLEEHGVQVLLAAQIGAGHQLPSALPLLGRMHDAVGLVEVLGGSSPDVLV